MKKPTILFIVFAVLFAAAAFLRLYRFEGFVTFLGDQGRDAIIMRDIITFKHLPAIGAPTSVGQVYLGPFYYYLVAPFLLLSNFNPVGLAYGVAILSLIGIAGTFYVVKQHTTGQIALITTALVATSSVLIELSRFSWNPNLLPFFTFFSLYFFYKWLDENSFVYAVLWGAFLAFCLQLHYLAIFSFIPVGIFLAYHYFQEQYKKRYLISSVVAALSFGFFTSPLLIFDLRHGFLNSQNFMKLFAEGGVSGNASFISKYLETVTAFMREAFQMEFSMYIAVLLFSVILAISIWLYKQNKNIFLFLNILNVLFFTAGFSLLTSFRHAHYFGPAYISFYLLLAYIPFAIKQSYIRNSLIGIFLAFFVFNNSQEYFFLKNEPGNQIEHSKKVAEFLAEKINKKSYNIGTWPTQFTEDPYIYFLEVKGLEPADRQKVEITDQMFVLCAQEPCLVLNSPSWNISMFGRPIVEEQWEFEGLIIYKLVHESGS